MITQIFKLVDKLIPDPDLKQKVKAEIASKEHELDTQQLDGIFREAVELAKHPSVYVSGARPTIIWVFAVSAALSALTYFGLVVGLATGALDAANAGYLDEVRYFAQGSWTACGGIFGLRTVDFFTGKARR